MFLKSLSWFLPLGALLAAAPAVRPAEGFLVPNDVIALVGGEDMVAAAEQGHLEFLLMRSLPDHHLKVRSLAWEGDTVFSQPREINYPTIEQQLDTLGITAVIAQFGQMESLRGEDHLDEFLTAYEKLIATLSGGGKRRVALVAPTPVPGGSPALARFRFVPAYTRAIHAMARRHGLPWLSPNEGFELPIRWYRDGVHLSPEGQRVVAARLAVALGATRQPPEAMSENELRLAEAIRVKNFLWTQYTRPHNWAFLDGDRSDRPASRDHLDPEKRWLLGEMEEWLHYVNAHEREIQAMARRLPSQ